MGEWKKYTLNQITEPVKDTYNPNNIDCIPYIGLEHIEQENLRLLTVGNSLQVSSNKFIFLENDILFGKLRVYFRKVIKPKFAGICSTDIWVFRAKKGIDQNFLFYFLANQDFIETANIGEGGTRMPRADWNFLKTTEWIIPPINKQKKISSILSCLDDKVELLHQQNKTLEKITETLFRKWFVEDAKEDWEEKALSSIANFLNGLACQKYPPRNQINKLPVLKIKELSNGISESSDFASTEVADKYIVNNGDVIFAWSASLMVKIWDGEVCILNQHLFKVTSPDYPKWFYYLWCKHHLKEFISIAASHATTMGHIKRKDLDEAMVLVPPAEELKTMTEQMSPLIAKIEANNKQIKTLTTLRDTLLPKLMSGEIKISD